MPMDEFSLIKQYFSRQDFSKQDVATGLENQKTSGVVLGIGDDCALLRPRQGEELAVSTDTLIEGVHFPAHSSAEDIAQRALRVNVSDIAAMGAEPRWFQLALTLPQANADWLSSFSEGLFSAAEQYGCTLVGGDTTRGPLAITITVLGSLPAGRGLIRGGGRAGDKVFVTGKLGLGAAGLESIQQGLSTKNDELWQAFWRPQARLREAQCLRGVASAAIDISDGLHADLGHIATASGVGAVLYSDQFPLSSTVISVSGEQQARDWALCGGDDYELCFTVSPEKLAQLDALQKADAIHATEIGELVPGVGVKCLDKAGNTVILPQAGYSHF